jgi:hypothetical protein
MKYLYVALLSTMLLPSLSAMEELTVVEFKGLYGINELPVRLIQSDIITLSISTNINFIPPKRNVWNLGHLITSRG